MPSPVLLWRYWFCNFLTWLTMKSVFERDCSSKIWSESHKRVFVWLIQGEIPWSLVSFEFLWREMVRVILFCQFVHLYAFLLCPAKESCDSRSTWFLRKRSWIPLKCSPWESTLLQHLSHAFQATWYSFCSSVLPCRALWQRPFS